MPRSLTMPKHRIPSFTSLLSPKVRTGWALCLPMQLLLWQRWSLAG